jgi:hypothetical protein
MGKIRLILILALLTALCFLTARFWMGQNHGFSTTSSNPSYQEAAHPSVTLLINGSSGPVTVGLGSDLDLAWTSTGVSNCVSTGWWNAWPLLNPFPTSGSSTQRWQGGGRDTNEDLYQITCTSASGEIVSSTVEVDSQPFSVTVKADLSLSNPYRIPSVGQDNLLALFTAFTGPYGFYLSEIRVTPSLDVTLGGLKVNLPSVEAQVISPSLNDIVWFADPTYYGPPFAHSAGPNDMDLDLQGFVWLPPESTTSIGLFGDIEDGQTGFYSAPFTIDLIGGDDGDPLTGPAQDYWFVVSSTSGQDLQVTPVL